MLWLFIYYLFTKHNDGENGRGTDQHTKSCFLYLLFIRT